jgi:hypothetical protein
VYVLAVAAAAVVAFQAQPLMLEGVVVVALAGALQSLKLRLPYCLIFYTFRQASAATEVRLQLPPALWEVPGRHL